MSGNYHLVVIGSGPGGYTAAIRSAQLGYRVAIVERAELGGVCLNWGCIPTKALLKSAHLLRQIEHAKDYGLKVSDVSVDFPAVIKRSRKVADQMARGVVYLMKKNQIDVIEGSGRLLDKSRVEVSSADGQTRLLSAERILLATGARPRQLPFAPFDGETILSSREALTLGSCPKSLAIIGGGVIGLEFADFYRAMGSEVTLFEALPEILPTEDPEGVAILKKALKGHGISIRTGVRVEAVRRVDGGVEIDWREAKAELANGASTDSAADDSPLQTTSAEKLLVAVGVSPNSDGIGFEEAGVTLKDGYVVVDPAYQSSAHNIYAIGDLIAGPALAHVAVEEGLHASEAMHLRVKGRSGDYHPLRYDVIPAGIYTVPELASVGLSEVAAEREGRSVRVGRFPFRAIGRARAEGESEGQVKIVADPEQNLILGAQIVGPGATELIAQITVGAAQELLLESFADTIHAHPTLSEAVMEAAAEALGRAINI